MPKPFDVIASPKDVAISEFLFKTEIASSSPLGFLAMTIQFIPLYILHSKFYIEKIPVASLRLCGSIFHRQLSIIY